MQARRLRYKTGQARRLRYRDRVRGPLNALTESLSQPLNALTRHCEDWSSAIGDSPPRREIFRFETIHQLRDSRYIVDIAHALPSAPDFLPRFRALFAAAIQSRRFIDRQVVGVQSRIADAARKVAAVHARKKPRVDDVTRVGIDDHLFVALHRQRFLGCNETRAQIRKIA